MADFSQIIQAAGIILDQFGTPLSSKFDRHKYDLILEQVDPHTNIPILGGMKYTFRGDDLPEAGLELFGGKLKTVRKEYPNNTLPDTQVIRTEENVLKMEGHFWAIDDAGVVPIDKVEFLHAMRLQGYPCRLSYMNGRIVRYGFITEFIGKFNDETDIEWQMEFEIYQIEDDVITSNTLPVLSTVFGRNQDILGRLNSGASALANVLALLGQPDMARQLRADMAAITGPATAAINAMGTAAQVFQTVGSITNMGSGTFQNFTNVLSTAALSALDAQGAARAIPLNPTGVAEATSGLPATLARRTTARTASLTTGAVANDLQLMQKDAVALYGQPSQMHIVTHNDTLRSISQQYYGNSNRWQSIAAANGLVDPQQLVGGMRLTIPK